VGLAGLSIRIISHRRHLRAACDHFRSRSNQYFLH